MESAAPWSLQVTDKHTHTRARAPVKRAMNGVGADACLNQRDLGKKRWVFKQEVVPRRYRAISTRHFACSVKSSGGGPT